MKPVELARVRGRLVTFAEEMFAPLDRKDQRRWGEVYLRGLMLEGKRKSIEPMAARLAGGDEQCLQQFVNQSSWEWEPVRERLAKKLSAAIAPEAWIIDDTGFPKFGRHSVGVARQYSGTLGKIGNCQLGVSINAAGAGASCPLDWRLFLPEEWEQDAERRAKARLPAEIRHEPKWRLALEMLDQLRSWGLSPPVILADAAYGDIGEFRLGLQERELDHLVQVKGGTSAYPEQVQPSTTEYAGRGRQPMERYRGRRSSLSARARRRGADAAAGRLARGRPRHACLPLPRPAGAAGRDQAPASRRG